MSFHTGTVVHLDACMHANVAFMLVSFAIQGRWVDFHIPLRSPLPVIPDLRLKAIKTSRRRENQVAPYYVLRDCQCENGVSVFECLSETCASKTEAYTPAARQEHPNPFFEARLQQPLTEEMLHRVHEARRSVRPTPREQSVGHQELRRALEREGWREREGE